MGDVNHRPSVSVIVPCKNEENAISQTITTIIESDYPTDKLKVVVIDDGSTDNTYNIAKQYESDRVKIVKHTVNKGKRQAFATGFNALDGDIVICIDSDTMIAKDAIKLLVQPFVDSKVVAVCGHGEASNKNQNFLTKIQHYWYQEMFILLKGMESKLDSVTCCSGILAAYRRDVVEEVMEEWLGEKFLGQYIIIGDDRQLTNLCLRGAKGISTRDSKVVYQSNAVAYTIVPDNLRQFFKQQLRWKRGSMHGIKLAFKFMYRRKFPIPLYYYIYQAMTLLTPIVIISWVIIKPLQGEIKLTIVFLMSVLYTAFLHGLNTGCLSNRPKSEIIDYMFYVMAFVPMSILMNITLLPYAWCTLQKGGWITRADKETIENIEVLDKPNKEIA
jgi:hyaluronan synthase